MTLSGSVQREQRVLTALGMPHCGADPRSVESEAQVILEPSLHVWTNDAGSHPDQQAGPRPLSAAMRRAGALATHAGWSGNSLHCTLLCMYAPEESLESLAPRASPDDQIKQ